MATKSVRGTAALLMLVSSLLLVPVGAASASSSLGSELLSVSDMPVGWSVTSRESKLEGTGGTSSGLSGCFDKGLNAIANAPHDAAAAVGFQYGAVAPDLAEILVQEKSARTVFARFASICTTGQMSFPGYGDSSVAITSRGSEGTAAYTLVMRKGSVLMVLIELGNLLFGGVPSVSQFEHFARLAASKVH
jgi:hypothetical protein